MPARVRRAGATADAAAALAGEAERFAADFAHDVAAGLIPSDATRPLTWPEAAAYVSFAALEQSIDATAGRVAALLVDARARLAAEVQPALEAAAEARPDRPSAGVSDLVADLVDLSVPLDDVWPNLAADTATLATAITAELTAEAAAGYLEVLREATAQGVAVDAVAWAPGDPGAMADALGLDLLDDIARRARHAAAAPARTALEALAAAAGRSSHRQLDPGRLAEDLAAAVAADRLAGLRTDLARVPCQQVHNLGRHRGARMLLARSPAAPDATLAAAATPDDVDLDPAPAMVFAYASELLDRSTCGPCSLIDGTEYETLDRAEFDYPEGTYYRCEGGARCRGTLVYVWSSEAPPTLPTPGDRPPQPPPGQPAPPVLQLPPGPPPAGAVPPPVAGPAAPSAADVLGIDDPEGVLADLTVEEIRDARAVMRDARAQARREAAAVQESAEAQLEQADVAKLPRPPALRQRRNLITGNVDRVQDAEGWDWFYSLDPAEQKRLRWGHMGLDPTNEGASLDDFADRIAHYLGQRTDEVADDAMQWWLENTRLIDAAGRLRRGKLPAPGAYSQAINVQGLAPGVSSRFDLFALFSPADAEANVIRYVHDVVASEADDLVARALVRYTDLTPPWEMSLEDYLADVDLSRGVASVIEPTGFEQDWVTGAQVPVFSPDDQRDLDRLRELIPEVLDDGASLEDVWHRMTIAARRAGLID